MPQQSHHKWREREQGKRGPGAEREGKGRGKQSGAGIAGEEQRRWAPKKKQQTKHQSTAHANSEVSKERKKHDAPDWSVRGKWEHGPSPRTRSSGVNPVPRTGASEATVRIRQKDAPDWSYWGGMKHNISPRTGSSGVEPGATDWSARGGRENTTNRPPGLKQPGRNEARRKPPDWFVRG